MLAPGRDAARLAFHLGKIVGKNLKGNRAVRNDRKDVLGKGLVIGEAGLTHERWICREALDVWMAIDLQHAFLVGTVGEYAHLELVQGLHSVFLRMRLFYYFCAKIQSAASPTVATATSGRDFCASP